LSLPAAQAIWRRALPHSVRSAAAPAVARVLEAYVRAVPRPKTPATTAGLPIRVVGLFEAAHGIGASARLAVRAFEALGVEVETASLAGDTSDWARRPRTASPAVWLFYLNSPELVAALAHLGPRQVKGPRFGYWAWELPSAPKSWLVNAALLDEVWTPSRYTAEAMAGARAPVRVVPHPLFLEDYLAVEPVPRRAAFQAVAVFDFKSSAARKNPEGAIEAFRRAFGDDPGCELTLKTQNGALYPELLAGLRQGAPSNVRIVDEVWPYEQVKALIAGADVLISLHRAEGFGLPIAEAMALGTPVLATAFSGPVDFLDTGGGLLVPWTPVAVADPQGIYRGQSWAEPDLDAAARTLVRLRQDGALRRRLAEAGRAAVAEKLSPKAWFKALPQAVQAAAQAAR
jgi:glycosyltransferase involved in cell wall biosynthesis